MKTTVYIDDELLDEAKQMTKIPEKSALVEAGLHALIQRASARHLAQLGRTQPGLQQITRRRPGLSSGASRG